MSLSRNEKLQLVEQRPASVGAMFRTRVEQSGPREAFRFPLIDGSEPEEWASVTWDQVGRRVYELAAGLIALGIEPSDRVAIASSTRYEWILADLAVNCAHAATTTVYPSTMTADESFILSDSGSRVVFVEDLEQLDKVRSCRSELPELSAAVLMTGTADEPWVLTLDELAERGAKLLAETPDVVTERIDQTQPNDLATLIYTSGTTGRPKGVRLSHDAWTYEGVAVACEGFLAEDDLEFLWLPLAHSFGKVLLTTQLAVGFCCAVDGRVPKIVDNLAVVKPTWMGAAPRIFEKAHGRIVTMMNEAGGIKLVLFKWAQKVALDVSRRRRAGERIPATLGAQFALADKLVCAKIRERFGGRVRFFISGSAPLSSELAEWFDAMGVPILEGYGLTETSAGTTVNHPDATKIGTVGLPMVGTEFRVAGDGELLVRGPGVMDGYHGLEAETAKVLSSDGWLSTGDIGEVDPDGFVRITDRKKDLFKTSGGKYVAPSHVEGLFKGICPLASQMLVVGANRKFCSALITLDPDAVQTWAQSHDMGSLSYAEVVASEAMQQRIGHYIEQLNSRLNRWETIKKWAVLSQDLSIESGEITPSLKVKRAVVHDRHSELIESFYRD